MKTAPLAALVAIAGLATGGGTSFGTALLLQRQSGQPPVAAAPTFVPTGKILAPLVFVDGRLAGYVSFTADLETAPDRAEFVAARLPLLLHAVNMRSYRTPMASGPDGMLPDLTAFRRTLMAASDEVFGTGVVKRVAITEAVPA